MCVVLGVGVISVFDAVTFLACVRRVSSPGSLVIASSQRNRIRETFWIINFGLLEINKRPGGSEAAPALRVDWISSERKLCSISGAV